MVKVMETIFPPRKEKWLSFLFFPFAKANVSCFFSPPPRRKRQPVPPVLFYSKELGPLRSCPPPSLVQQRNIYSLMPRSFLNDKGSSLLFLPSPSPKGVIRQVIPFFSRRREQDGNTPFPPFFFFLPPPSQVSKTSSIPSPPST